MPKQIDHRLTITGPNADIGAFVEKARAPLPRTGDNPAYSLIGSHIEDPDPASPLCFHAIVPLPASYHEFPYSTHGAPLEVATWSVKWGACDEKEPVIEERKATYVFTCAGGLPAKWLRAASKSWPTLTFWCSFGGAGVAGRVRVEKGEYTFNEQPAYDSDASRTAHDEAEQRYIASHDAWVDG